MRDGNYFQSRDIVLIERIVKIEKVIEQGIYAPETESGHIVVNNIMASIYTDVDNPIFLYSYRKVGLWPKYENFIFRSIRCLLTGW